LFAQRLVVAPVDENASATCAFTAVDIAPPIPDQKGARQIYIERCGCIDEHPGTRLPAFAVLAKPSSGMITNLHSIDWQLSSHRVVHRFHAFFFQEPTADIRLVSHDDEEVSGVPKGGARLIYTGQDLELGNRSRRVWFPLDNNRPINYSVTIEENGFIELHRRKEK
jgi:hypothetical protein